MEHLDGQKPSHTETPRTLNGNTNCASVSEETGAAVSALACVCGAPVSSNGFSRDMFSWLLLCCFVLRSFLRVPCPLLLRPFQYAATLLCRHVLSTVVLLLRPLVYAAALLCQHVLSFVVCLLRPFLYATLLLCEHLLIVRGWFSSL